MDERDHDFRERRGIAGNMTGKRMHVGYEDCLPPCRGAATNAATQGNAYTGYLSLKRPEHEFATLEEIESRPIQIR
jgi:hypothetical protein